MTHVRNLTIEKFPNLGLNSTRPIAADQLRAGVPADVAVASERYGTLDVALEADLGIYWAYMRLPGRPIITEELLADVQAMRDSLRALFRSAAETGQERPFTYFVFGSRSPGVYNLGGDLAFFADRMKAGDRASIQRYARTCVDRVYQNSVAFDLPIVTIALVQGDALGGGFETALSYDLIAAERSAKFGLPEILFNLFPGMGAYSFLSRRIGAVHAQKLIMSGQLYTAEELHELGLIDILADDGQGEAAVCEYVKKMTPKSGAQRAFLRARRRVEPVSYEELRDVVDIWVDAVFELGEADLRKMLRLASAQDRRVARTAAVPRLAAE